jgi:hypothetical protein
MGKKQPFTDKELKTKYNRWMNNFIKGIQEIQNLPQVSQNAMWFVMLQECLFNTESNVFLAEMYKRPNLYNEEDKGILSDVQLAPMNRARLIEGMKTFVMSSGKKKWQDTLHKIEDSFYRGDY